MVVVLGTTGVVCPEELWFRAVFFFESLFRENYPKSHGLFTWPWFLVVVGLIIEPINSLIKGLFGTFWLDFAKRFFYSSQGFPSLT